MLDEHGAGVFSQGHSQQRSDAGTAAPAGDVGQIRLVELWIPAAISLFIGLRWLLAERHSAYGDEFFHLTNLWNGVASARGGGVVQGFVNLYLFNFAYPPVFHLLSAPFVLTAADPVLGGRFYTQILTLLVSLVLYTVTRQVGGKLAGAVAVATLLGTPSFVDVSRHYLLEPLLVLEVLLVLLVIGRYYSAPRHLYLIQIAGLLSAGLLTKFNFFLYAAPLFLVPSVIELRRVTLVRQQWSDFARMAAMIIVVPLALAGPWYLARATGPMSATGMLGTLYDAGTVKAGLTPRLLLELAVAPQFLNYSMLVQGLALVAALVYATHVIGTRALGSLLQPMSVAQHVIVSSAFVCSICIAAVLALTGLGGTLRWHVEAAFVLVATFGIIGRLRPVTPRILAVGAAGAGAALQLITLYFAPVGMPALLRVPASFPRPSTVPVGSESLARDIARHEKGKGGTKSGEFVYFLYHEHNGPHFGSVEFYLRFEGAPLMSRVAAFYDRAIDIENIFDAKYLVEAVAGHATEWMDPETLRYRRLAEHLPPAVRNLLVEVSDVEGRFGHFKAYYVPRERITLDMVLSTIKTGRELETVEPFLILWDAQGIIWRAKFERMELNETLGNEIDSLLARVPAAKSQLSAINGRALDDYLVKIHDIRRNVGDARAPVSAGSAAGIGSARRR